MLQRTWKNLIKWVKMGLCALHNSYMFQFIWLFNSRLRILQINGPHSKLIIKVGRNEISDILYGGDTLAEEKVIRSLELKRDAAGLLKLFQVNSWMHKTCWVKLGTMDGLVWINTRPLYMYWFGSYNDWTHVGLFKS